jgi:RNA polymerase sigma-70 factor (ECF subfamily)
MDAQTMLNILDKIDDAYRAPLVLYYVEDLSYKEIADVLEIPLGTVQSRIARAKVRLFQLLTDVSRSLGRSK